MLAKRISPEPNLQFLCGLQSKMADDDLEEEEDGETEITLPEIMIEWERIHSPSSASHPSNGGWSIVDNSLDHPKIVFPPVNHEGLDHIFSGSSSPHDHVKEIDRERVATPPSPLPTPRPMIPTVGDATGGWWEAGLEMLRFKFAGIVSTLRKFAADRGLPMSFQSHVTPLAGSVMLLLLYLRFRRRLQIQRGSIADLIRVVREKDEEMLQKMNAILHQVARMNEVLQALASHHGARATTP